MLLRNVCSASRRDDTDRSLARSAWESVPRRNRPVGYGMIGRSLTQSYFSSKDAPCFSRKAKYSSWKVRVRSHQSSNRCAHLRESHRTLWDGSFGVVPPQALRARLRSHRPSGTFRNRIYPSKHVARDKLRYVPPEVATAKLLRPCW